MNPVRPVIPECIPAEAQPLPDLDFQPEKPQMQRNQAACFPRFRRHFYLNPQILRHFRNRLSDSGRL